MRLLLRDLKVARFRSLHDVGALTLQRRVTVLTGHNDGGKTATLDALGLLLKQYTIDDNDPSSWIEEGEEVVVEGAFEVIDGDAVIRMRVCAKPGSAPTRQTLDRMHREFDRPIASYLVADLNSKMDALGIPRAGMTRKQELVDAFEFWRDGRPENEFEDRWRTSTTEELDQLPEYSRFTSDQAVSPTAHIQSVLNREARRLLDAEPYAGQLQEMSSRLDADIATATQQLREKILEYRPELSDVDVSATFDFRRPNLQADIQIRKGGEPIPFGKSGEGLRRHVALAIHEASLKSLGENATKTEIIAYDEPDTHLDYAAQRSLFEILSKQAAISTVQVVVATHSLNFIDRVPMQAITHFRLSDDSRTMTESLTSMAHGDELEFLAAICSGLGLRNSVLLDERCFLVIEGETEEAAVPALYRLATGRSLTEAGVTLLNTHGHSALRKLVETLVTKWGRRAIVLADSDTTEKVRPWAATLGLQEGTTLYFIGQDDFEDAFADDVWLEVLTAHYPPTQGGPWTLADLDGLRAEDNAFGKALCKSVRQRCQDHTIGKPAIGLSLAQTVRNTSQIPAILAALFAAAQ